MSNLQITPIKKGNQCHMLVPAQIVPKIKGCKLLHNIPDNVSDHVALSMTLELETEILDGGTVINSKLQSVPAFPKPQWQNKDYVNRYKFHLNAALVNVKCSPDDLLKINNDSAVLFVNNLHDSLCDAMHEATRQCSTEFPYKRVKVCKAWWTRDCTRARDRNRLFFHIWKSVGRPKQGVTYDCYRESRRAYRRTCKQAVENEYSKKFNLINKLYKENKTARMWNLVRKSKGNRTSENAINMNTLKEHFRVKFDAVPLNKTQCEALDTVNIKYDDMRNAYDDLSVFSVYKVRKDIKQLRLGCAPGAMDGITAEHLVHSLTTDLPMLISCLLTVCICYGIVPDAFFRATLVPILKKSNLDPTLPQNYRPIMISTTLSKVLEYYILEKCKSHVFSEN